MTLPILAELDGRGAAAMNAYQTLRHAESLVQKEDASGAINVLEQFLEEADNIHVWLHLSRAAKMCGRDIYARAILRNIVLRLDDPHVLDIISARVPYAKPHVLDRQGLIYVSVPKCGSSTVKDALLRITGKERVGELSHYYTRDMTRVMRFEDIRNLNGSHFRFAVVRSPLERIRSYWKKNVDETGSLKNEAKGKSTYYGLQTKPSYPDFLRYFGKYRSTFIDFRHHTDSLIGFLGRDPSRYDKIYNMAQMPDLLNDIYARSNLPYEEINNMKGRGHKTDSDRDVKDLEDGVINDFYRKELQIFERFF